MYRQESYTTNYMNTLCLNFWANPLLLHIWLITILLQYSSNWIGAHVISTINLLHHHSHFCLGQSWSCLLHTQQTFLGHSLAADCSVKSCLQSCSELKPGRSYFYSLYQTKVKEEQPSPDSYNEQRPRRATTQAAKQRGIFQKRCVENNSEIWKHVGLQR